MTTMHEEPILLTVRGTLTTPNLDAARALHNSTAGSPEGIAAARALGDLSHKVYVPAPEAGTLSSAKPGEVLFIDTWVDPAGLMQFFSNHAVQEQAGKLFASRLPTVWMAARGAATFHLPAPSGQQPRFVGMIRASITSPEAAIEAFRGLIHGGIRDARRRGQLSHDLYIKLNPPGDTSPVELLGVDVWTNLAGLTEHYTRPGEMANLASVFTARPEATVWQQAEGGWSEWQ